MTHKQKVKRAYYLKHRKRFLAYYKAYRKKHPIKVKRCQRRSTKKNPEAAKARMRRWNKRHPGRARMFTRRYYKKQKGKVIARSRRWRKENPERYRASWRKSCLKQYGITINEFEVFRLAQKDCCRICKKQFKETPNVDHSHKTGAVRGLLCRRCNIGLGMFGDSLKCVESAATYLKETEK